MLTEEQESEVERIMELTLAIELIGKNLTPGGYGGLLAHLVANYICFYPKEVQKHERDRFIELIISLMPMISRRMESKKEKLGL